jgi:hypothetical protein
MAKTLVHRLDDACATLGLEWVVLPFEPNWDAWHQGPYWGALVTAQFDRRGGRASRFYHYNEDAAIPSERRPDPEAIYITLQPSGRDEIKRLLLAQLEP